MASPYLSAVLYRFPRFFALNSRCQRVYRWRSTIAGKAPSDFVKPFIDRV
jgi:hypothetical protein